MLTTPLESYLVSLAFGAYAGKFSRLLSARHLSSRDKSRHVAVLYIDRAEMLSEVSGDLTMAGKNGDPNGKKDFKGWCNIALDDEDKAAIMHLASEGNPVDVWDWIGAMTFKEYRFSFSWDAYSSAQQVAMYCWAEVDPNFGYALSARHPDLDMALWSLMYKHERVANGRWIEADRPRVASWG